MRFRGEWGSLISFRVTLTVLALGIPPIIVEGTLK